MFKTCELNWEQLQRKATWMIMGRKKLLQETKEMTWFSLTKDKNGERLIL